MKAIEARAAEVLATERATTAEQGLDAAKVCEAALQKSMADIVGVLQSTLETLEMEWNALGSERKARSEAVQEVLAL